MDQQQILQKTRDRLDTELREIQLKALKYQHTYFEPTEKTRLQYDAMVYKNAGMFNRRANNRSYIIRNRWQVIWISRDPETPVPRMIQEHFELCEPGQPYMSENLYHYPFTIYY